MSMENTLDLPVWMAIDLARAHADATVYAVVDRILDRWKLHDFGLLNLKLLTSMKESMSVINLHSIRLKKHTNLSQGAPLRGVMTPLILMMSCHSDERLSKWALLTFVFPCISG